MNFVKDFRQGFKKENDHGHFSESGINALYSVFVNGTPKI